LEKALYLAKMADGAGVAWYSLDSGSIIDETHGPL
jgi:hypothetical protein